VNIIPISFRDACDFVSRLHRNNKPPVGQKFSIGLRDSSENLVEVGDGRPSGGLFSPVKRLDINDAGTIKRAVAAWINDGGVFKKLFPAGPVDIADSDIFDADNSVKRWTGMTVSAQKYWMIEISIPVVASGTLYFYDTSATLIAI
jgi:hypothetical protein